MSSHKVEVVVAGHTCLDIIPTFEQLADNPSELIASGRNVRVGPAKISTGGAVPNTGLALHRLGVAARLVGKIGDDLIGRMILDVLTGHDPRLAEGMIVAAGQDSSYSIVISSPQIDRSFIHCAGANDTFSPDDVPLEQVAGARIFHVGYPPIMRKMVDDGGRRLADLLHRVRELGVAVSLDMAQPSLQADEVEVDWPAWLARILPEVDIFLPSVEEALFMVDPSAFPALQEGDAAGPQVDGPLLSRTAARLLKMGVAIVGLKLGDRGFYLRTAAETSRLKAIGGNLIQDATAWLNRELLTPCFQVEVAGTTGTGDSSIAGFLAGLLHGLGPQATLRAAAAAGACSAEQADATSGLPPWSELLERIRAGWALHDTPLSLPGWTHDVEGKIWQRRT